MSEIPEYVTEAEVTAAVVNNTSCHGPLYGGWPELTRIINRRIYEKIHIDPKKETKIDQHPIWLNII